MSLGQKIIDLRDNINLSRKQLAIDLNIPYNTLSKYETDERQPDYETLKLICTYLGVTTDLLLDFNLKSNTDTSIISNAIYKNNITESELLIATYLMKDLEKKEREQLVQFAKFLKFQRENDN